MNDKPKREMVGFFRCTQEELVRLAQMLYDSGRVSVGELEEAFGARIEEVKNGKLVWETRLVRIVRIF